MRRTFATCALGALSACGGPEARFTQGNEVLSFTVSHFKGSYRFVVYGDHRAVYGSSRGHGHSGKEERVVATKVKSAELQAIAKTLREANFCSLRSSDRPGVPDEARPEITVRLEGLDCRVEMWDGEFHDEPRAREALAAVEDLGKIIRARAR